MSFRDELELARTDEELREVMERMIAGGSPKWTYLAARKLVRPGLRTVLGEYFDDHGLILPQPPSAQPPPAVVTLPRVAPPSQPEIPDSRASARPASEIVRDLYEHTRGLLSASAVAIIRPPERGRDHPKMVNGPEDAALVPNPMSSVQGGEPVSARPRDERSTDTTLCPICQHPTTDWVQWRDRKLCRTCHRLLRGAR